MSEVVKFYDDDSSEMWLVKLLKLIMIMVDKFDDYHDN